MNNRKKFGCLKCRTYTKGNPDVFPIGWCTASGNAIHKLKRCPGKEFPYKEEINPNRIIEKIKKNKKEKRYVKRTK